MKVLIIHDRPDVAELVRQTVTEKLDVTDQCDVVGDYQQGRDRLAKEIYDLLIVDLTLPLTVKIGAPGFEAVEALLTELFTADTLHVPGDVIGITNDEDALRLVENRLGPHLMVAIIEDADGLWKRYLQDKIDYARRATETRALAASRHFACDALLITALDVEMEPYEDIFELTSTKHFQHAREFLFTDKDGVARRGIAYAIGRSGQPSAASLAQALITFYRPRVALMSGICGGVEGKVKLGDLVFFEAAYAWDYGKWEEDKQTPPQTVFYSRPDPIDVIDHQLHHAARGYRRSSFSQDTELLGELSAISNGQITGFEIHIKPVASGSAVIASDEIIAKVRGLNDSVWAVDMESYGFYHAAMYTRVVKPHFICVKAVSDYSNGEKGDTLHPVCSFLSAALVHRLLTKDWNFRDSTWSYTNA